MSEQTANRPIKGNKFDFKLLPQEETVEFYNKLQKRQKHLTHQRDL
jgi:hypothetical protein